MKYNSGQLLRGYLINKFVQSGGFSSVYQAYQDAISRHVAIKIIEYDELVKSVNFIRRFEIEAQIIARLEHPHIVPIYDFWREPDQAFIVMRWLEGGSIRNLFSRQPNLRFEKHIVSNLIRHVGSALSFVHQHGIVHRDIKPDNILIDDFNNFYLTDFGIALEMQKRDEVELDFLRIGTPNYMSPEQILYDTITYKSDIYAFAILVFEVLAAELPFSGKDMDAVLLQHVHVPFPSILPLRPDLSIELDAVLSRAASKSPEDRFDTIHEFIQALLPLFDVMDSSPSGTFKDDSPLSSYSLDTLDLPRENAGKNTTMLEGVFFKVKNPYKGLQSFTEADAHEFYGRDATIEQMLQLLRQQDTRQHSEFLAVIGASGSGKSSVVKAGLIPQLRQGEISGSQDWFYVSMTPGHTPIQTFVDKLNSVAVYGDDDLLETLQRDPKKGIEKISNMVSQEHIFVLIDQFEELFTQVEDESVRKHFIDLLTLLSQSTLHTTIVITLRADFYDKPLAYRELGQLIQSSTVTVLPMSSDELEQAILEPARFVHVEVQPSLVSQLIADTISQPNALPLLQFAITELFEKREDNVLTLQAYESMGRLQGSIIQRADSVFALLNIAEQAVAQKLFLQLVILSNANETVRRRIMVSDALLISASREVVERVINTFGDSRLLIFDNDPLSRQPTIEVAHEALIRAWTRLQLWIAENRSALMTHNRLMTSVRNWFENNQDKSFLARDAQLLQYEELYHHSIINLTDDERKYVVDSQGLRERNQRIRYAVIASLIALTIASVIFTLIAVDQQGQAEIARKDAVNERDRANQEAMISQSRASAATALNKRADGRIALLTAVAANRVADTFEARDSLAIILSDQQSVDRYSSVEIPVRDIAVSENAEQAYIVGDSNQILVWNADISQSAVLTELETVSVINSVAHHSGDSLLAVGGMGGFVIVDTSSAEIVYELEHDSEIWSVAWSVDGQLVYLSDSSGVLMAIDAESYDVLYSVSVADAPLFSIATNPDGNSIAIGSGDNIIYVVDSMSGDGLYEFAAHENWVLALAYSPDGNLLASGGADLSIIVWDLEQLQPVGRIPTRHVDWIRDIAFSPDGSQLLTASADSTLRRWDVASGRQIPPTLSRHTAAVWSGAYLSDYRLLSADQSGGLVEWTPSMLQYPLVNQAQLDAQITDVVAVAKSNEVVIAINHGDEPTVLRWFDLLAGEMVKEIAVGSFVTRLDYHEESQQLAYIGIDQTVHLIDMSDSNNVITLGRHDRILSDIDFSPDGRTLIAIDDNGTVLRWDIQSRTLIDEQTVDGMSGISIMRYLNQNQIITGDRSGQIVIWDRDSLDVIHKLPGGHDGAVTDVLQIDDVLYSVGRDGMIIAWDVDTWAIDFIFPMVHNDWIHDVVHVDDKTIATIGRDSQVVIWDVESQQAIGQPLLGLSDDWGLSLIVDEASQTAYGFYRDGAIMTWELSVDDWIARACDLINIATLPDNSRSELSDGVCVVD